MMGLRSRRPDAPPDPLAPVLTRVIDTARPVFEDAPLAGVWAGTGCGLVGARPGDPVDDVTLEGIIRETGGALDVVVTETPDLIRATAIRGGQRDERWFSALMDHASRVLPEALEDSGLDVEHVVYLAAMYAHPVSYCWPGSYDVYHVHAVVAATVG